LTHSLTLSQIDDRDCACWRHRDPGYPRYHNLIQLFTTCIYMYTGSTVHAYSTCTRESAQETHSSRSEPGLETTCSLWGDQIQMNGVPIDTVNYYKRIGRVTLTTHYHHEQLRHSYLPPTQPHVDVSPVTPPQRSSISCAVSRLV